jgi:hypothetical protein
VPAVLKLFNTFVMRENKGKCFSPLAQKYFFGFTHHKSTTKDYNAKTYKVFYLTHSLENYTRFFTKMFIGLLS